MKNIGSAYFNHILSTGFPNHRIMMCHRGFAPGEDKPNPLGLRNIPDWEMAKRVQKITGLPMIIDPSHMDGTVPKVISVIEEGLQINPNNVDNDEWGWMIEAHPHPIEAQTDAKQQLTPDRLRQTVEIILGKNDESADESLDEQKVKWY